MTQDRSGAELLKFLDYVASKGLMSPVTARSRKASANKVFSILSEEEAEDVTALDVDAVMLRFSNLEGRNYTPESLMTYKSRVKSAIDDFSNYLANPMTFKSRSQSRERKDSSRQNGGAAGREKSVTPAPPPPPSHRVVEPLAASNVLNIPMRADLIVRIHGLPFDMTPAEAKKVSNVILAMATPTD